MSAAADQRLLGRAARIAKVLGKYGFNESRRDDDPPELRARRLREALEELGPTFAKLGQILSTRPDLIPPEAVAELAALQDRVTPLDEHEVVTVMEQELGVPWEDVFETIEAEPLAAGTIAEVHRATLPVRYTCLASHAGGRAHPPDAARSVDAPGPRPIALSVAPRSGQPPSARSMNIRVIARFCGARPGDLTTEECRREAACPRSNSSYGTVARPRRRRTRPPPCGSLRSGVASAPVS
jgi:hypothetical protein